jgi:hypothetical protein
MACTDLGKPLREMLCVPFVESIGLLDVSHLQQSCDINIFSADKRFPYIGWIFGVVEVYNFIQQLSAFPPAYPNAKML